MLRPITILPRRDQEQTWIRENPVLKWLEICVVYTEQGTKYKLGNGQTDYIHLPFVSLYAAIERGVMYVGDRVYRVKGFVDDPQKKQPGGLL